MSFFLRYFRKVKIMNQDIPEPNFSEGQKEELDFIWNSASFE